MLSGCFYVTAFRQYPELIFKRQEFEKIDKKHLNDKRFLLLCLIPTVLHGIWDMPINIPYCGTQIAVSIIAWLVIIYFINLGLQQVDETKKLTKTQEDKS